MYGADSTYIDWKIRKSEIVFYGPTTNERFEELLPNCGCSCEKLEKILNMVLGDYEYIYDYITVYSIKTDKMVPEKILVVPACDPNNVQIQILNSAAEKVGCKIKFEIHYPETGILIIKPLQ